MRAIEAWCETHWILHKPTGEHQHPSMLLRGCAVAFPWGGFTASEPSKVDCGICFAEMNIVCESGVEASASVVRMWVSLLELERFMAVSRTHTGFFSIELKGVTRL